MILSELFDTTVRPEWHDRSQDGFSVIEAEFTQGQDLIRVTFKRYRPDPSWDIAFYRNGESKMTNAGSAITILSQVSKIIIEFIRVRRPEGFSFSSDRSEPSRTSLYRKLSSMLHSRFPEYRYSEKTMFRSVYFNFERDAGPEPIEREYLGAPVTGEENKPVRLSDRRRLSDRQREELDRIFRELEEGTLVESNPWTDLPVFYHGTSSRNLDDILRFGLQPQSDADSAMRGNHSTVVGYTERNLYLTTDYELALRYARAQVRHDGENGLETEPVVFRANIPNSDLLLPDDDFINLHGTFHMWNQLSAREKLENYPHRLSGERFGGSAVDRATERAAHKPFTKSLKQNNSVAYRGRIPASFIKRVH